MEITWFKYISQKLFTIIATINSSQMKLKFCCFEAFATVEEKLVHYSAVVG